VKFFWLNFHLPYRCRHSGACCTAGWPITVEPERAILIRKGEWLAEGGVLPVDPAGACVFHHDGCTVYENRPLSCVHFPYVCMIDPRGVHVTLSHFCPTAAALLFEHDGPIEVVEGPSPVPLLEIPEGLDARDSLPPLREPSSSPRPQAASPTPHAPTPALMSWEEFAQWERDELKTLRAVIGDAPFAPVIERYLAAKLFASWAVYEDDDGIAAVRKYVRAAYLRLREEMEIGRLAAERPVDAAILLDAIRRVDFGLFHLR
jgi:Putative zinc- or iron-chelating domain